MARSTTRETSIAPGWGGPGSNVGLESGISSALVVRTPALGVSGNGLPGSSLIPARTRVCPEPDEGAPVRRGDEPGFGRDRTVLVGAAPVETPTLGGEVEDVGREDLGDDLLAHWAPPTTGVRA